jgi:hypothetical protein
VPFARQPKYEVLHEERTEGPLNFFEIQKLVDLGRFALDDSLRETGQSEWKSVRAALKREKTGTTIGLGIFAAFFITAGVLLVWCGFRSFVPGSGFTPPSHALGAIGVIMVAIGVGLALLAYNTQTTPIGKLPRKLSQTEIVLYWGGLIAGLITVLQLP